MAKYPYAKGLHEIGTGIYGYIQPDGSWGWNNAGLVSSAGKTLLVDTLFDLKLTAEMLATMRARVPQAARIDTLVNTHANGDHTFGNQLVEGAEIIASKASAEEMEEVPPKLLADIKRAGAAMGPAGAFFAEVFAPFDFEGIAYTLPTRTFSGETSVRVGDKKLRLIEVGPAHTRGDVMAIMPDDKVAFTGDILFIEGHPIMWNGPVGNWIKACDLLLSLDLDVIVPGHGPITDKQGVRNLRDYLVYLRDQTRARFEAGMKIEEAARDIAMDKYAQWIDGERVVVNVYTLYREFAKDTPAIPAPALFGMMAAHRDFLRAAKPSHAGHRH